MSKPSALASRVCLAGALACLSTAGCVILSPDASAVTTIDAPLGPPEPPPPAPAHFKPLGELMGRRCGTLDCHGQVGRNLRIYGQFGLRAASTDFPGGSMTTPEEYMLTYESAIALEPEIMSEVVQQMGAQPDRLTLVRKPRAEESHKGGKLFLVGDPQDVCMTSWLASNLDATACETAIQTYP
jgi:hypothetical protein